MCALSASRCISSRLPMSTPESRASPRMNGFSRMSICWRLDMSPGRLMRRTNSSSISSSGSVAIVRA